MSRDLVACTVVITGASSGIWRAAAHEFVRRGSRVVLAARTAEPLELLADELGPAAIAVPTDVRDERAVFDLARRALERFGQVHGARAALPVFRERGTGVLINMASVWGRVTAPEVSAYVTSKFAVRAFSECLRQELRDLPEVDVATMLPQAVDTPIFEHAANYSGRRPRPIPPVGDPHVVACGIVRCAESPKPEVTYSHTGRLAELAHVAAPGCTTASCRRPSRPATTTAPRRRGRARCWSPAGRAG